MEGIGNLLESLVKFTKEFKDNCSIIESNEDLKDKKVKMFISKFKRMGGGDITGTKLGDLVKIRRASKEDTKTYLGIFLGDAPIKLMAHHDKRGDKLVVTSRMSPAIFVPETREIIYGCESWWGKIQSEDGLKEITDGDIENTWYVKMWKDMIKKETSSDSK